MENKLRIRILGYIEKALEQGWCLRQIFDGSWSSDFTDDYGTCCVLGAIAMGANLERGADTRENVAALLGINVYKIKDLEQGFEGYSGEGSYFELGQEIAETYR